MSELTRPAARAQAITKSDTTTYEGVRGVYVGGAGNLAVTFPGSSTAVTFVGVAAGSLLPIQPEKIMSTNTTATDILALF